MKPKILSIDTSSEFGSLALSLGEEIVEELPLDAPGGFGQVLIGSIERLLAAHGWSAGDVDCYAAANGPGSFTGMRIALAAAKGLAASFERPLVGVSNLLAVAWYGTGPKRAAVLDARRGEIYGGLYGAGLEKLADEVVMPFRQFLDWLPRDGVEIVAQDFTPLRTALDLSAFANFTCRPAPRALAAAVARIAAKRYAAGLAVDPALVDANYVRRSDAERFWVDK
jgi:tRNA threonylcarbamoyladenosine biosynthesis protein TsaB